MHYLQWTLRKLWGQASHPLCQPVALGTVSYIKPEAVTVPSQADLLPPKLPCTLWHHHQQFPPALPSHYLGLKLQSRSLPITFEISGAFLLPPLPLLWANTAVFAEGSAQHHHLPPAQRPTAARQGYCLHELNPAELLSTHHPSAPYWSSFHTGLLDDDHGLPTGSPKAPPATLPHWQEHSLPAEFPQ